MKQHMPRLGVVLLLFALILTSAARADLSVEAGAAIAMEVESGTVLYQQNADDLIYPASLTKVMTALVAVENCPLDEPITVTASALADLDPDSSSADLAPGEQLTLQELLYCMFLVSANDASCVVAEHVGGTTEHFVEMMNETAAALGCTGTHFANPHGLHDDAHYTTARDLLLWAEAFYRCEVLMDISSTTHYSIPATAHNNAHELYTIIYTNPQNIFPGYCYEGCRGIKTGSTSVAGKCLMTFCERDGLKVLAVVTGCPATVTHAGSEWTGSYAAMHDLLDYVYDSFDMDTIRIDCAEAIAARADWLAAPLLSEAAAAEEPETTEEPVAETTEEPAEELPEIPAEAQETPVEAAKIPESTPLPWYIRVLIALAALLLLYAVGVVIYNIACPTRRKRSASRFGSRDDT